MMDALFYLSVNVMETLLAYKYMNVFYQHKKLEISRLLPFVVGGGCSIMMTIVNLFFNNIYLIILGVTLNVFAISSIYKVNYKNKIVLNSLYIGILLVTSLLSTILFVNILDKNFFLILMEKNKLYLYFSILFDVGLKYLFVHVICKMKLRHNEHVSLHISVLLGIIPFITIAFVYAFSALMVNENIVSPYLSVIIILGILYMNILVFYIFDLYNMLFKESMEKKLMEQELLYKNEYYKSVEENQIEIRSIRHNLKNQQIAILQLFENGEYFEAAEALRSIVSAIDKTSAKVYTQNSIVNSILNTKLIYAEQFNIHVDVDIQIPSKLNINTVDLGVLLGNLLDNAIEACEKCDVENRFIEIKIGYHKGNVFIDIKNSMPGNGLNRILKTAKVDKLNHGLGLKSVKNIINKYYGTLEVTPEPFTFDVQVLINED